MKIRILKDLTDRTGDSDLFVPKDALAELWSDEGDYLIVMWGNMVFPVVPGEYEYWESPEFPDGEFPNGRRFRENLDDPNNWR